LVAKAKQWSEGRGMIETVVRKKIESLIERADNFPDPPPSHLPSDNWVGSAKAWLAECQNVVEIVLPDFFSAYRQHINTSLGYGTYVERIRTTGKILESLLKDIDAGLLTKFGDKVRSETFDTFLDHAVAYQSRQQKDQAGVIAGVVFEDTVRKIYSNKIGPDGGRPLEDLINELTGRNIITGQQSKQAKVAAHVRTKATHAKWDEFDLAGVDATISLTKTFLREHMGG
jgi:hypothetical protein